MKDIEIWKVIDLDFESTGLLISSHGNAKRADFKDKKIGDNGNGYKLVKAAKLGHRSDKKFYVHRLVAQKFLQEPKDGKTQVNHIDGDKSNNHWSNLEWVTPKENIRHMHESSLNRGRLEHGSTITLPDEVIAEAYFCVKSGTHGVAVAATKFGMPRTTLSSIVNKRSRKGLTDEVDKILKDGSCKHHSELNVKLIENI